jgi:hypothetical protein
VGEFKESDFSFIEKEVGEIKEGEVLVRTVYLSLDPTNRIWAAGDSYLPAVGIGDVMRGIAVGVVEESKHEGFQKGDLVQGFLGWQLYSKSEGKTLTKLFSDPSIPIPAYLGLLGHIGLTAYFGLLEIGLPKAGETLVVSAAAGAVGSLVCQIGKIQGCRVVAIAGTDEKCQWLMNDLGADAAINYKTESVAAKLKETCPDGIDVYFDNVGGEILDAVLSMINLRARIVMCGLISQYTSEQPVPGPYNLGNVLIQRARIEGFIITDYLDRAMEGAMQLGQWLMEGKIQYRVDIVEGLENAPRAINRLFEGTNKGKLMVKISEEP